MAHGGWKRHTDSQRERRTSVLIVSASSSGDRMFILAFKGKADSVHKFIFPPTNLVSITAGCTGFNHSSGCPVQCDQCHCSTGSGPSPSPRPMYTYIYFHSIFASCTHCVQSHFVHFTLYLFQSTTDQNYGYHFRYRLVRLVSFCQLNFNTRRTLHLGPFSCCT